jgi:hypothetical protein
VSTELKGRVKEDLWNRSTCLDKSDRRRDRQRARRDFKKHNRTEEGSLDVAASDLIEEGQELGDPPIPDPDDNREQP